MYPPVNRRNFLIIQALVLASPAWVLANPVQKVQTLAGALAWPLAAVLAHVFHIANHQDEIVLQS
jgi:hypothetical protein